MTLRIFAFLQVLLIGVVSLFASTTQANDVSVTQVDGVIQVTGDEQANSIGIYDFYAVTYVIGSGNTFVNGGAYTMQVHANADVNVDLGAGDDNVFYWSIRSPNSVLSTGAGDDIASFLGLFADLTISTEDGDDQIYLGSIGATQIQVDAGRGDDRLTIENVQAADTNFYGQRGRNALYSKGTNLLGQSDVSAFNTPVADAYYVDQDHPQASDANDGRYVEDGGTGPWKTIQKALDEVQPGQTVYVRASAQPYFEVGRKRGTTVSGNTFLQGGTVDNPVTIAGYPGERPVIDGQGQRDPEGRGVAGFYVHFGDYITIRDFEIRSVAGPGVNLNPSAHNHHIVVEFNHIHHIYEQENIGGVRLDHGDHCVVRNNIIHHIYNTRSNATSNRLDSEPHGLHSGIHGFQPANCTIENNLIYHVSKGVFQKQADRDGGDSHTVRNNIFYDIEEAAFAMNLQGAGQPAPRNAKFYDNVVHDSGSAVSVTLQNPGDQGDGIAIHNNTVVDTFGLASAQKMKNIEVFNNIYSGQQPHWWNVSWEPTIFIAQRAVSQPSPFVNEITYFDNNLYHNVWEHWMLERNGSQERNIYQLSTWQNTLEPALGLPVKPDQQTVIADPLFVDRANHDYSLQPDSPAWSGGRAGSYPQEIGAVRPGVEIGPNWSVD